MNTARLEVVIINDLSPHDHPFDVSMQLCQSFAGWIFFAHRDGINSERRIVSVICPVTVVEISFF